ncbi:carbohydrate kinase family protein [Clostridium aminobutyricum]|uniref:Carbohydrate kinase family protein n=1 Tax=Clostridium aminobutyricum TaxID=33953 RepID=A0A939DAH2_CLOAM|nr:carbohydrate kinase family protein [Clostridium aminobutyricum]MBN7773703.1 carbohydrate kinase family protein [Clostridium aminobutyricum]
MSDITIIGGITADIEGNPYGQLARGESNPGKISIAYGGVGRNITENLARLGADVAFVSAAGNDFVGRAAVQELKQLGVNIEKVSLLDDENTAMYLSILNIVGDMELALCNMDVLERISIDFIHDAMKVLKASKIVGIDANLTEEVQDFITRKLHDAGIPVFLDPVSAPKAERAKKMIGRFHTIKPNRGEAEILSGLSILNEEQLRGAGRWFSQQGVKRIFITLGSGGVYYKEGEREGIIRPQAVHLVSATGAGDAFSAAIMDAHVKQMDIEETARYGMAAAAVAMEAKTAVNPKMCLESIDEKLRKGIFNLSLLNNNVLIE